MSTKVVVDTVSVRSIKKQFHSVDMYTEYRAICQEENGFFSPVPSVYENSFVDSIYTQNQEILLYM